MLLHLVLAAATGLLPQSHKPSHERPRAADEVLIPRGRPVLLDGRADATEWDDAARVELAGGARLLLKHDGAYVYAAVALPAPRVFGVNLYLAPADSGGPYLNLHASARLGERLGRGGSWPPWRWWNNTGWAANVARFNGFDGPQRFLPDGAKEFQVAVVRWPGAAFRLSLDLEVPGGTEYPLVAGLRADGRAWCIGRLAP